MTLGRWQLPNTWNWVEASEVADIVGGGTPSTKDDTNFAEPESGIPWIGPADLTGYSDPYISRGRRDLSEKGLNGSGATLMPKGTVLFSSRAPIGYCVIAANDISTNQGFKSWVCADGIMPEYVRRYLLSSTDYADSLASGTTFREISGKRVGTMAVPVAPSAEQRRIVAKLDALTARLARARAELDRVLVLAERLLSSTLSTKFSITGATALVGDISSKVTKGSSPRWQGYEYQEDGVLFVRSQNVRWGHLALQDRVYLPPAFNEKATNSVIQEGDVLLNIVGASIGRVAVADNRVTGANCNQAVSLIRPLDPDDAKYLMFYLLSPKAQTAIVDGAVDVARANFSLAQAKALKIPWPSKKSRSLIVGRVEQAFARVDRLKSEAARARKLIDRLEIAILAKAFRGELVPQDPDDEPASVLLERIRAERAAKPKPKRGRRAKADADA